jgi:hypothetical protein
MDRTSNHRSGRGHTRETNCEARLALPPAHFSDTLIDVNLVLSVMPRLFTTAMIA